MAEEMFKRSNSPEIQTQCYQETNERGQSL